MRILQISSARSIGGGERHVVDLSNGLAKRGHDVFVALAPGSPLFAELSDYRETNVVVCTFRNALDLSAATVLTKFVRENKIELINVHLAKDYPIAAAVSLAEKIPYVITRHVLFPMSRIHRFVLRDASFVIAPSNAVAASLKRQRIFREEKIVTIRYGLDPAKFPEREIAAHDGVIVGSVGNLDPVKGFDVLIRAAAIVKERRPDATFTIVGEDRSRDRSNEKDLRELVAALGLADTVKFAGFSDNIADVLRGFDIFVLASRSESFGFVIAEAMLSGVPVIATETEGAKEIISDPSLGRIVPIESPEKLAEAILKLFSEDHRELTRSARRHVVENFSVQRMIDETEALYRRVVISTVT